MELLGYLYTAACVALMIRALLVGRFMSGLLDLAADGANRDICEGRHWRWRYRAFDEVSFFRILFTFWKPMRPESFWSDTSFLEDT